MSLREVLYAFTYLAWGSLLIPVGLGIWNWSRLSLSFRILTLCLGSYVVILAITYFKTSVLFGWDSGHFFGYLLSLLFGMTFTTIFALALPTGQKRSTVIILGLAAAIYLLFEMLFIPGIHSREGYSIQCMSGVQIAITLIFLYHLARYPTDHSLLSIPLFWVAGGHLLSGLGGGVLDVFYGQLVVYSHRLLTYFYIFYWVVLIICHILYAVGIWKECNRLLRPTGLSS